MYGYSGMGVYNYFPTWGVSNFAGWGLGSYASTSLYSTYTNPYYATVVATEPAQTTVVYDYSQPINVTSTPPEPSVAESTEQVFSAARDSFKAGDYQRALDLTDQVLKQTPDAAVVHEFRALCLFALKRYDEAAAVNYAVLTAGPGLELVDAGRALSRRRHLHESASRARSVRPRQPQLVFRSVLAGVPLPGPGEQRRGRRSVSKGRRACAHRPALGGFRQALQEGDRGRGRTAAQPGARAAAQVPAGAAPAGGAPGSTRRGRRQSAPSRGSRCRHKPPGANDQTQQPEPPPPPPASLVGVWKAQASPDVTIALTLEADGKFAWEVDTKGKKQTLNGVAGFKDNTLALLQQDGPPLVGKVTQDGANKFVFAPTAPVTRRQG